MMKPSVRSARIMRGGYVADLREAAAVHVVADQRVKAMEAEIRSLKTTLEEFQRAADLKTAEIVESEVKVRAKAAYEKGFEEGRRQGFDEGLSTVKEAVETVRKLIVDIESGLDVVWKNCRDEAIRLTLAIARKIVGNVSEQNDVLARELASRCMALARDQTKVKILVNPRDVEVVSAAKAELMSTAEGVKSIEIAERASVERGGVIIETEGGQVDGRLSEQLDVVEASLNPGWSRPDEN
ncbi:MAG TPA: hypothetical protein ENL08_00730, partial [Bacteroidetes bacterium]|nr:hypothetical protein [Bacteroidota bacterium]